MEGEKIVIRDQEELRSIFNRLLERGIKPNARQIASIVTHGQIAAVMFELDPENEKILRDNISWKGEAVWRMSTKVRKAIAAACAEVGDFVGERWLLAKERKGRIFVYWGSGTFLVNFEPGHGYWPEPGSSDTERTEAAN
jgi:hypothetical protein